MSVSFTDLVTILRKIVDISIVWFVFYYILKNIKSNVKLSLLFKGLILVVILWGISYLLKLIIIGLLIDYIIQWGPIALIVIFQPEIRNALEQLGRTSS